MFFGFKGLSGGLKYLLVLEDIVFFYGFTGFKCIRFFLTGFRGFTVFNGIRTFNLILELRKYLLLYRNKIKHQIFPGTYT